MNAQLNHTGLRLRGGYALCSCCTVCEQSVSAGGFERSNLTATVHIIQEPGLPCSLRKISHLAPTRPGSQSSVGGIDLLSLVGGQLHILQAGGEGRGGRAGG